MTVSEVSRPPGGVPAWPGWTVVELALVASLPLADALGLVPLSRTPFLLLIGWASLRRRGLRWRDIGFALPSRAGRAVAIGIVVGVMLELSSVLVTVPLIAGFTGVPVDSSDLRVVTGSPTMFAVFMALNWSLAAFGEEVAFRGYLASRVAGLLGGSTTKWVASLILVSIYFGLGHSYQGITGIIQESWAGFLLGVLYLASGKNLTTAIVAHGTANTVALVMSYVGHYPGL